MSDFTAQIRAVLNVSQLATSLKAIEKQPLTLSNVSIKNFQMDTSNLISQVQNALNSHKFTINVAGLNTPSMGNQMQNMGNNAGQSFVNAFNNSIKNMQTSLSKDQIKNLAETLRGFNFDQSQIKTVTQQLGNMDIAINNVTTKLKDNKLSVTVSGIDSLGRAVNVVKEFDTEANKVTDAGAKISQTFKQISQAQAETVMSKSNTLSNNIQAWMNNNTKAAQIYGDQLRDLQSQLKNNTDSSKLGDVSTKFKEIQSAAKAASVTTNSFGSSLKNTVLQVAGLGSAVAVVNKVIGAVKQGVQSVQELDTALVDLQKTTTASMSELNGFYEEANSIAKEYGATTQQVIQGAADWSRLGYSLKDSETMSKLSSMFTSISPGLSYDEATSGLVSVMKAFDISAEDALDGIMSKINIVGNSFAVSNKDIMEGLKRTSASMAAMGQDLDSTIALFTAANEVLQDSASTGTALRSMALRMRGFDEETEQLSDDLVGLSGKIVDLTKTEKNPMGVSIFTDETQTQYKDFVDYFRELSEVYDDMSAKNQTALLDNLFGKRGAQAGSALIKNFDTVEAALDKMSNSAGAAENEMSIITESIEYKMNNLKQTGVGIAQNLFQREEVGTVIDLLTSLLEIIDKVTESLGLLGTALSGIAIAAFIKNFA